MKHNCPNCKCEERRYITITEDMSIADRMKVQPALGKILKCDIGKRVYFVNGYPQAESLAQFNNRKLLTS